jgi:hypothetical protein
MLSFVCYIIISLAQSNNMAPTVQSGDKSKTDGSISQSTVGKRPILSYLKFYKTPDS